MTPPARLFKLPSWERLEALAAQHGAIAQSGRYAGQPSVHTLLAAIEAGALDVVAAEPAQPAATAPQPPKTGCNRQNHPGCGPVSAPDRRPSRNRLRDRKEIDP